MAQSTLLPFCVVPSQVYLTVLMFVSPAHTELNGIESTHRTYISLDTAIFKSSLEKWVSMTTLVLHNYLLFSSKLQPFSKTLEKCKQRYLKHQQYSIKGLIKISRKAKTAQNSCI